MPSGVSCSTAPWSRSISPRYFHTGSRRSNLIRRNSPSATRSNAPLVPSQAIVESRDHRNCLRRGQDRSASLSRRCQGAQHEQQRLPLDGDEVTGERRAVVQRAHGIRRPRQVGDALLRVSARDLDPGRQQHPHVEPARRVADEMQLAGAEAAAVDHLPTQSVRAPRNRRRRLRCARHDAGLDASAVESVRERQLHVFEVTEGPERSKTEKPWNQENESFAHGGIMRLAARCGTAPTRRKRTSRVASWTYTGDIP
jgi:hypothetical protein